MRGEVDSPQPITDGNLFVVSARGSVKEREMERESDREGEQNHRSLTSLNEFTGNFSHFP